jgi:hypothetical protein
VKASFVRSCSLFLTPSLRSSSLPAFPEMSCMCLAQIGHYVSDMMGYDGSIWSDNQVDHPSSFGVSYVRNCSIFSTIFKGSTYGWSGTGRQSA